MKLNIPFSSMRDWITIALVLCATACAHAGMIINPYVFAGGGSTLGDGLLAHYTFEEGSTPATDSSGNGRDLTSRGTPVWSTGHKGTYSLDLSGGANYVTRTGFTGGNADITVATWIRFTTSTVNLFVSEYKSGVGPWYISYSGAARAWGVRIYDSLGGNDTMTSPGAYPSGDHPGNNTTWYHVLMTYKSSTQLLEVYVNGAIYQSETQTLGGVLQASSQDFVLGGYTTTAGSAWTGANDCELDNVRIYDRVVTSAEIAEIYAE